MGNIIKKAFFDFIDKTLAQEGQVLDIKRWNSSGMYEVRVALPHTDMIKWNAIPRIKVKVADFEYRDYSPAEWDLTDNSCSLFVEARHTGEGSLWVQQLKAQQKFVFAPAYTAALPSAEGRVLCVGDGTALGHFFALKQLTNRKAYAIDSIVSVEEGTQVPSRITDAHPEARFIEQNHSGSLTALHRMLAQLNLKVYSSIYLAGYIPMVQGLRKILKSDPDVSAKIFANGFWK